MILFTLDIDWASEEVILDTLSLFEAAGVKCTLFATHQSNAIIDCNKNLFEVGIHPNFNGILNGNGNNINQVLDELLAIYPEAKGARSHSLTQSGPILNAYKDKGLVYEVNHFMPYHNNLKPFYLWNGLLRIPFNWEDDYHFALNKSFTEYDIDFNENGQEINILNFHPVHIYVNTETYSRYLDLRFDINKYEELDKFKNISGVPGTRDILFHAFDYIKNNNLQTYTMSQVVQMVEADVPGTTFEKANRRSSDQNILKQ
ncbi:MAG: hypothetical protein WCH59_01180 [Chitinophagia bacterium]|jgi:hypothetical protein